MKIHSIRHQISKLKEDELKTIKIEEEIKLQEKLHLRMVLEQKEFKCLKELVRSLKVYPREKSNQVTMISYDHSLGLFKITGPSEDEDSKKTAEPIEQEETIQATDKNDLKQ